MATREENIKKINEELEKVAGGFYARSKVGDVKPDVNIENQRWMILDKIIHVR